MSIQHISALTLFVTDMARSCDYYQALGLKLKYGGPHADFTSLYAGRSYLNLSREQSPQTAWGRAVLHVDDVDALYKQARSADLAPKFSPRNAPWGERYFHIRDPDGHELSFATPLPGGPY